jgi:hypothetical protein
MLQAREATAIAVGLVIAIGAGSARAQQVEPAKPPADPARAPADPAHAPADPARAPADPARAPVDASMRDAARKIAAEAILLFDRAQYRAALEKFELANRLIPAPTLALRAARCLDKLGRLIEASERYLEVARQELPADAPEPHRKAQQEALEERAALLERIPGLALELSGPLGSGVAVSVDGRPLPATKLGERLRLDPGRHVVEARRFDITVRRQIELREGEEQHLTLQLPPLPQQEARPRAPSAEAGPARGDAFWYAGWSGVGVGIAGVVLGAANGVAALAQESSLESSCPDRKCPPTSHDDADRYNTTRGISTAGFLVGAAGLAFGVTFLVLAPSGEGARAAPARGARSPLPPAGPRLDARVTWGGAAVRGIF